MGDFAGFSKSPSGLEYKVVAEGYGVKPKAGQGIKAHYSGYLLNGAKFDSSYDRRKPLGFDVGTGRVIKGWDEALLDMKVGELRVLKIPSNLGYGAKGAGGSSPRAPPSSFSRARRAHLVEWRLRPFALAAVARSAPH